MIAEDKEITTVLQREKLKIESTFSGIGEFVQAVAKHMPTRCVVKGIVEELNNHFKTTAKS